MIHKRQYKIGAKYKERIAVNYKNQKKDLVNVF